MAKVNNKVIDIINSNKKVMSINTKRLDAVFIENGKIKFVFQKNVIHSAEFDTFEQAEEARRNFVKEWRGENE